MLKLLHRKLDRMSMKTCRFIVFKIEENLKQLQNGDVVASNSVFTTGTTVKGVSLRIRKLRD
ncbi:hypothetical protein EJ110_NYTH41715 [Nymphaea thermarum]|nr:hypothetical protein EJ110_NYTH41715 [Nymphaea thermarum]